MMRGWVVLTCGLLMTTACAHNKQTEQPAPSEPVTIVVTNHNALPVEIDVIGGGTTHRLGMVNPGLQAQFIIPQGMIGNGSLYLRAQPNEVHRRPFESGPLLLSPGIVVDFLVTPQLFNSTATIRP